MTKKQKQVYNFIVAFQAKNGYPPSRSEIAKKMKVAVNAVSGRLDGLVKKGHIAIDKGVSRGIRIL